MDIPFLIRSIIFLTAGLIVIIFTKQIYFWTSGINAYLAKKLHIKYNRDDKRESDIRALLITGYFFLIISVILFFVAIYI